MEATVPEKIYIPNNPAVISAAYSRKTAFNDVEYTRTDGFIEKAVKWLNRNTGFFNEKDFRKAMKGE
jgi:hypothetical protein